MEEDIVITVDFEGGDGAQKNAGHIQVVPATIQWEDFELMVCCYADIVHVYKHLPAIASYLDCVTCHFLI